MSRRLRVAATLVVSALAIGYILLKIDVGKTAHIIGTAKVGWVALSAFLIVVTVLPMAWRWQRLLEARGIQEELGWLTRAYFVSYAVGQVLPTSVGGDASRIYETSRRHPGQITPITGSVLLERALGGAVTLLLAGCGFLLAIGRYAIGAYLWIEMLFVVGTVAAGIVFFSRSVRRRLVFAVPLARRLRVERIARAVYDGIHGYRDHPGTLARRLPGDARGADRRGSSRSTQRAGRSGSTSRRCRTSCSGRCSSSSCSSRSRSTASRVREAFFVSFLGRLGVDADAAFALRLPLLPPDARAVAAGARRAALGEPAQSAGGARWHRHLTSPSSS